MKVNNYKSFLTIRIFDQAAKNRVLIYDLVLILGLILNMTNDQSLSLETKSTHFDRMTLICFDSFNTFFIDVYGKALFIVRFNDAM